MSSLKRKLKMSSKDIHRYSINLPQNLHKPSFICLGMSPKINALKSFRVEPVHPFIICVLPGIYVRIEVKGK